MIFVSKRHSITAFWFVLLVLCAGSIVVHSQDFFQLGSAKGASPVTVTGGYRLYGQTANRQGSFSQRPADLWRMELNPTVSLYGVPLTVNLLLSSEQQGLQQEINAFSFTLNPDEVKRIVTARATKALEDYARSEYGELLQNYDTVKDSLKKADPERYKELESMRQLETMRDVSGNDITNYTDALQGLGLMSDVEEVMSHFPTIGVGTVFPIFSPLTISGVRLTGASLEWNPGWFYIHLAEGTTQRPLLRLDTVRTDSGLYQSYDQSYYGRNIYSAKIGVGRRDGEHVYITGMYGIDDKSSISFSDTNSALAPQKNMVGGLDFKVDPIPGIWTLQAEVNASLTVSDLNAPQFNSSSVPPFLLTAADSNVSSYFDWAATAQTVVNVRSSGTKFNASVRRIGSGYRSMGAPNLRTDLFRYDVRVDQSFFSRQFTAGLFYRRDRDNLIPFKRSTSTLTSLGATIGLNIRKLPFLRVSYSPYVQENNATDTLYQLSNHATLLNASSGYAYRIGDLSANSGLSVGYQSSVTRKNVADYSVFQINGTQTIGFVFPVSLTAGLGYITQNATAQAANDIVTVDVSGSYLAMETWSNSAGLNLAFDALNGTRVGFFLATTLPLGEFAVIDLRLERNIFNELITPPVLGGSYKEVIFRATISKSW